MLLYLLLCLSLTQISSDKLVLNTGRILSFINIYRNEHSARPLYLNVSLSNNAQNSANMRASLGYPRDFFKEYKNGEIIGYINFTGDTTQSFLNAIDMWYGESSNYSSKDASCNNSHTCAFTQLIWKASNQVGFGFAPISNKLIVVVSKFYTPGNIQSKFQINVSPTKNVSPSIPPSINYSNEQSLTGNFTVNVMLHMSGAYTTVGGILILNALRSFVPGNQIVNWNRRLATPGYSYNVWYSVGPFSTIIDAQVFISSLETTIVQQLLPSRLLILYIYPVILLQPQIPRDYIQTKAKSPPPPSAPLPLSGPPPQSQSLPSPPPKCSL